eukprot:11293609-Alexandrium_andersonii.AAC.1
MRSPTQPAGPTQAPATHEAKQCPAPTPPQRMRRRKTVGCTSHAYFPPARPRRARLTLAADPLPRPSARLAWPVRMGKALDWPLAGWPTKLAAAGHRRHPAGRVKQHPAREGTGCFVQEGCAPSGTKRGLTSGAQATADISEEAH